MLGILRLAHLVKGIHIFDDLERSGRYRHMQIREGHFRGGLWCGDRKAQAWRTGWLEPKVYSWRRALNIQLRNLHSIWYWNGGTNRDLQWEGYRDSYFTAPGESLYKAAWQIPVVEAHQAEGSSRPAFPTTPSAKNTSCPTAGGTETQCGCFLFPNNEVGRGHDSGRLPITDTDGFQGSSLMSCLAGDCKGPS